MKTLSHPTTFQYHVISCFWGDFFTFGSILTPNLTVKFFLMSVTVFVGDLSYFCTEAELTELFTNYGRVERAIVRRSREGMTLNYGFLTISHLKDNRSPEDMVGVVDGQILLGRQIRVTIQGHGSQPQNRESPRAVKKPLHVQVYLRFQTENTKARVDESVLRNIFCHFGTIGDVIVKEHSLLPDVHKICGYAFLYFLEKSSAIQAVAATFFNTMSPVIEDERLFLEPVITGHQAPPATTKGDHHHHHQHPSDESHSSSPSLIQQGLWIDGVVYKASFPKQPPSSSISAPSSTASSVVSSTAASPTSFSPPISNPSSSTLTTAKLLPTESDGAYKQSAAADRLVPERSHHHTRKLFPHKPGSDPAHRPSVVSSKTFPYSSRTPPSAVSNTSTSSSIAAGNTSSPSHQSTMPRQPQPQPPVPPSTSYPSLPYSSNAHPPVRASNPSVSASTIPIGNGYPPDGRIPAPLWFSSLPRGYVPPEMSSYPPPDHPSLFRPGYPVYHQSSNGASADTPSVMVLPTGMDSSSAPSSGVPPGVLRPNPLIVMTPPQPQNPYYLYPPGQHHQYGGDSRYLPAPNGAVPTASASSMPLHAAVPGHPLYPNAHYSNHSHFLSFPPPPQQSHNLSPHYVPTGVPPTPPVHIQASYHASSPSAATNDAWKGPSPTSTWTANQADGRNDPMPLGSSASSASSQASITAAATAPSTSSSALPRKQT